MNIVSLHFAYVYQPEPPARAVLGGVIRPFAGTYNTLVPPRRIGVDIIRGFDAASGRAPLHGKMQGVHLSSRNDAQVFDARRGDPFPPRTPLSAPSNRTWGVLQGTPECRIHAGLFEGSRAVRPGSIRIVRLQESRPNARADMAFGDVGLIGNFRMCLWRRT